MVKRIITALGMLTVILSCVFWLRQYSLIITDILILAFSVVGGLEMYRSMKKGGEKISAPSVVIEGKEINNPNIGVKPILSSILTAMVIIYPLIYFFGATGAIITLCISSVVAVSVFIFKHDKLNLKDLTATVFIIVYPVITMSLMIIMNHSAMGLYSIFLVFAVVVLTDTMAYFVGVTCKGPKLCPKISPKKTISGAIGGVIGGMLGAVITFLLFNHFGLFENMPNAGEVIGWNNYITIPVLLIVGAIASVVAELGDLGASIIKRKIGIKDYGNLFPGHGGVMDRIDGFLFVIPIVYMAFEIIYSVAL